MLKFQEYMDKYVITEWILFPEYQDVKTFIEWLKSKNVKDLNNSSLSNYVNDYQGNLDMDFLNKYWSEFDQELIKNGIETNFTYNN
jgi:hypothetical protein